MAIDTTNKYIQDPNNPNASILNPNYTSSYVKTSPYSNSSSVKTTATPTTQASSTVEAKPISEMTAEEKAKALSDVEAELYKRTGVDLSKTLDQNVVVDSSEIKNAEQQGKAEEVKKASEENQSLQQEANNLGLQSQIAQYKQQLGIEEAPKAPSLTETYSTLQGKYNVEGLQSQLNDITTQINDLTTSYKQNSSALEGQGRGITTGIIRGQQSKLEEQYQNQLQSLELKQSNISTQISNANSAISTIMQYTQQDYSNAKSDYDTKFSQQMQLSSAINSKQSEEKQTANSNLNIAVNAVKGSSWEELDVGTQASIQSLALQSGLDISVVKALINSQDVADVLTTATGYDADGNQVVTILYKGKDGKVGAVESYSTGATSQSSSNTTSDTGFGPAKSSKITLSNEDIASEAVWRIISNGENAEKSLDDYIYTDNNGKNYQLTEEQASVIKSAISSIPEEKKKTLEEISSNVSNLTSEKQDEHYYYIDNGVIYKRGGILGTTPTKVYDLNKYVGYLGTDYIDSLNKEYSIQKQAKKLK